MDINSGNLIVSQKRKQFFVKEYLCFIKNLRKSSRPQLHFHIKVTSIDTISNKYSQFNSVLYLVLYAAKNTILSKRQRRENPISQNKLGEL